MPKINSIQFESGIRDLEIMFKEISTFEAKRYYETLGNTQDYIFKKAVNWLIENHPYKRFPLIAEFKDAIREVYDQRADPDPEPPKGCYACNMTGWQIHDILHLGTVYKTAIPCSCGKGKIYKKAVEYLKRRKK